MASIHLRNALSILDSLIASEDLSPQAKEAVAKARREVLAAQDDMVWARGRAREAMHVLEELAELLGLEAKTFKNTLALEAFIKKLESSPHVEATVDGDGKVKIEKLVPVARR